MGKDLKMKNPVFDEKFLPNEILKNHEEAVESYGIPSWSIVNCPVCEKPVGHRGVRNIGICLNSRNIGDICVNFHCTPCSISSTLYFKENIRNIKDFCSKIMGEELSGGPPINEDDMYRSNTNNLVDNFLSKKGIFNSYKN